MFKISVSKKLLGQNGEFELSCDVSNSSNDLISIFGPSGSGKSTLLRMIAGLESPDSGYINVGGSTWFDSSKNINIPPKNRSVGFVFQAYSLFPNMSVIENILFAQPVKDMKKVKTLLELTELQELANIYPDRLSGGQKQRVALARAIAREPNIMLLDEPFAALDAKVRRKLQDELIRLKTELGLPMLFVSHDKEEVFRLSNKVMVIEAGRVDKLKTPSEAFFTSSISGKFSFHGRILSIKAVDIAHVAYLSVGGQIVQVLLGSQDVQSLSVGDEVQVAVKAFNPIIKKL